MAFPITIQKRAVKDAADAYQYYQARSFGLGDKFLADLNERYTTIAANPQHYSFVGKSLTIKDVKLTTFPFTIIFRFDGKSVVVLSVYHEKKRKRL